MAYLSLWVANVSFPIETLANALTPLKEYSPEKLPFAKAMMRYFGPVTPQSGELYNRSVLFLRERMFVLLNTVEVIYSVCYDELSSNLPYYAQQCGEQYELVVRELLAFLQSYPQSPAGEYFVSIFQMVNGSLHAQNMVSITDQFVQNVRCRRSLFHILRAESEPRCYTRNRIYLHNSLL